MGSNWPILEKIGRGTARCRQRPINSSIGIDNRRDMFMQCLGVPAEMRRWPADKQQTLATFLPIGRPNPIERSTCENNIFPGGYPVVLRYQA